MPRTRAAEVPKRQSPTGPTPRGPRPLRTSRNDSDLLHQRPLTEHSPRLPVDRLSPRGAQSDSAGQKKLGTRITDLETQLVQAQHELKSLKNQLSSAEAAKNRAQEELSKKGIKKPTAIRKVKRRQNPSAVAERRDSNGRSNPGDKVSENIHPETDVFEVPVEKLLIESKNETNHCSIEDEKGAHSQESAISDLEKLSSCEEVTSKGESINQMKAMLEEKERKNQAVIDENQTLKQQLEDAKSQITSALTKEEEMESKLRRMELELEASKASEFQLKEKLLDAEAAKESFEVETKKMKVQTEQWRKAADAAAAILSGGVEMNGRTSERCASIDNHFNGISDPPVHVFGGHLGSPGTGDDTDDGSGGGKKKGSGIKMLGELWKKKGQR